MKSNTNRGPGRPMYNPVIPRGKFTMTEFCIANGVNPKTGKGKNCSKLTLIKFLGRKQGKALIMKVKGETADPQSKKGLGRKAFLYTRKAGVTVPKTSAAAPTPKATAKRKYTRKATAPAATTADYEATKAALLAPTPVVSITPDPTPAPVAEDAAPAPEAVAAETATVASEATAEPVTA